MRSILLICLIFTACKSEKKDIYIDNINSQLPKNISEDNYWIIYRIGSIEFSNEASVLCIPKNIINNKKIKCDYFIFNYNDEYGNSKSSSPSILGFKLLLQNNIQDKFSFSKIEFNKNKITNYQSLNESHCDNEYYINPITQSDYMPIMKSSQSSELKKLVYLYQQISPSEYYQSLSLSKSCVERQDLIYWLRSEKTLDSLNFKITKDYWYIPGWLE